MQYETETPIVSFATLGAKNYSYTTEGGQSAVKARGFTLESKEARGSINHDSMKKLLKSFLEGEKDSLESTNFHMAIDRKTLSVRNTTIKKSYKNDVFDKRFVARMGEENPAACTLPFGLKHANFADCDPEDVF